MSSGVIGPDDAASFESALERARRDDSAGFTWLYERFGRPVLAFLTARGATEPEELVNDVFLAAFRNLEAFDGAESAFVSWLFAIARNKAIDRARWSARRPASGREVDEQHLPATASVDRGVVAAAGLDHLLSRLAALSDDQRDVLILRFVNDLSIEQTAAILGKTQGAVKQLQLRGLAGAKRLISDEAVT